MKESNMKFESFALVQVFRPILRFNSKFTIKDLENALLMPNSLLEEIHIALLKVQVIFVR